MHRVFIVNEEENPVTVLLSYAAKKQFGKVLFGEIPPADVINIKTYNVNDEWRERRFGYFIFVLNSHSSYFTASMANTKI